MICFVTIYPSTRHFDKPVLSLSKGSVPAQDERFIFTPNRHMPDLIRHLLNHRCHSERVIYRPSRTSPKACSTTVA